MSLREGLPAAIQASCWAAVGWARNSWAGLRQRFRRTVGDPQARGSFRRTVGDPQVCSLSPPAAVLCSRRTAARVHRDRKPIPGGGLAGHSHAAGGRDGLSSAAGTMEAAVDSIPLGGAGHVLDDWSERN